MASIPSSPSRLVKLSQIIARNSNLLNSHLVLNKLPQPSFAADAPPDGIVIERTGPLRNELEKARRELVTATKELYDLSVGARETVRSVAGDFNAQLSLHFIHRNRIATLFAPGTTITYEELAKKTSLPVHDLKRLIRHAIAFSRIFSEPTKGTIAHTPASLLLATDTKIQAWVGMSLAEFWPAATRTVDAMEKWPSSQEPTHTGLSVALGEEKHLFQVIGSDPERAQRFGLAMSDHSTGEGYEVSHLVAGYDWAQFSSGNNESGEMGVVVDVGGSLGFSSVALAERYEGIRFIVQDLARTFAKADPMQKVPDELKDRIEFMAHDFFTEQKVQGADVYLIRWCLHNWSDKYALKMLRALIPALKKGARVVVNDGVLPEPKGTGASWKSSKELSQEMTEGNNGEMDGDATVLAEEINADWADEKGMRNMDLIMLEGLNARERDVDEWEALFKEADERFIWRGAFRPEGCKMCIMEAEWAG